MRRQRCHGIFLRPAAKERLEPATLGHPRRTAAGDRHLDRAHLPPPTTATTPRPAHPHRVRTAPRPARNRGLITTPPEPTKLGALPPVSNVPHSAGEAQWVLGNRGKLLVGQDSTFR